MQTHRQDREKNNLLFTLKEENLKKKKKKTSLQRKHRSKGQSRVNMKANNENKLVRQKETEPIYTPKHTKDNQGKGKPLGNKQQLKRDGGSKIKYETQETKDTMIKQEVAF